MNPIAGSSRNFKYSYLEWIFKRPPCLHSRGSNFKYLHLFILGPRYSASFFHIQPVFAFLARHLIFWILNLVYHFLLFQHFDWRVICIDFWECKQDSLLMSNAYSNSVFVNKEQSNCIVFNPFFTRCMILKLQRNI